MIIKENMELTEKYSEMLLNTNTFYRSPFIHRSDLIYCLRKAFFRMKGITKPKPSPYAPLAVIGKTLHVLMEIYKRREVVKTKFGFTSSIDMFKEDDKPIEIKTTRANVTLEKLYGTFKTWREQVGTAILFTNEDIGHLFVLNVISGKLNVYDFSFESETERTAFKKQLLMRKRLLKRALKIDNYQILPCSEWECRYCEYEGDVCKKEEL